MEFDSCTYRGSINATFSWNKTILVK